MASACGVPAASCCREPSRSSSISRRLHLQAASCRPPDLTAVLLVVLPHRPSNVADRHHRIPVSPVAAPRLLLRPPSQSLPWPSSSMSSVPVFTTASGNPITCGDGAATQIQEAAIDLDFPSSW
uniref:Uncharacterized protein n=1 Tax=Oryza punctata TaxID=4537 RepID=A0A0E0JDV2_ORYPU